MVEDKNGWQNKAIAIAVIVILAVAANLLLSQNQGKPTVLKAAEFFSVPQAAPGTDVTEERAALTASIAGQEIAVTLSTIRTTASQTEVVSLQNNGVTDLEDVGLLIVVPKDLAQSAGQIKVDAETAVIQDDPVVLKYFSRLNRGSIEITKIFTPKTGQDLQVATFVIPQAKQMSTADLAKVAGSLSKLANAKRKLTTDEVKQINDALAAKNLDAVESIATSISGTGSTITETKASVTLDLTDGASSERVPLELLFPTETSLGYTLLGTKILEQNNIAGVGIDVDSNGQLYASAEPSEVDPENPAEIVLQAAFSGTAAGDEYKNRQARITINYLLNEDEDTAASCAEASAKLKAAVDSMASEAKSAGKSSLREKLTITASEFDPETGSVDEVMPLLDTETGIHNNFIPGKCGMELELVPGATGDASGFSPDDIGSTLTADISIAYDSGAYTPRVVLDSTGTE